MDELEKELSRLLRELADMDRYSARSESDPAYFNMMTIARRGTNIAIAEIRSLINRRS